MSDEHWPGEHAVEVDEARDESEDTGEEPAVEVAVETAPAEEPQLELEPTDDILSALSARRRTGQTLVGFAAEHGEGAVAYGRDKLARKGLDAVVVNDIARRDIGFDSPQNEVTIVTASGEEHVARSSKTDVARAVLATVARLRAREPAAT